MIQRVTRARGYSQPYLCLSVWEHGQHLVVLASVLHPHKNWLESQRDLLWSLWSFSFRDSHLHRSLPRAQVAQVFLYSCFKYLFVKRGLPNGCAAGFLKPGLVCILEYVLLTFFQFYNSVLFYECSVIVHTVTHNSLSPIVFSVIRCFCFSYYTLQLIGRLIVAGMFENPWDLCSLFFYFSIFSYVLV